MLLELFKDFLENFTSIFSRGTQFCVTTGSTQRNSISAIKGVMPKE